MTGSDRNSSTALWAPRRQTAAQGARGRRTCGPSNFARVEVIDDERGKPEMPYTAGSTEMFEQQHITQAVLALAHCRDSAIAVVILQGE